MFFVGEDLFCFVDGWCFLIILVDLLWQFINKIGKVVFEYKCLLWYGMMNFVEISVLLVLDVVMLMLYFYLWCLNVMLLDGLVVMKVWGFMYKFNIVWYKIWKDGGFDGCGVGFYFCNVMELIFFGV